MNHLHENETPATSQSVLLSIAIPTFNRCQILAKTLDSIVRQVRLAESSRIEIVISDNCSSDGTQEWVQAWIGCHPDLLIRYYRNEKNVGLDANNDRAVHRANGRFVWFFADDDFLEEEAVPKVYSLLKQNSDVVFAFVNYSVVENGVYEDSACAITNTTRLSGGELIVKTRFAFSFVSSCIFSKYHWLSQDASRYHSSNWIVIFMARDVLRMGDALLIGERLIRMNGMDLVATRREKRLEGYPIDFYINAHLNFLDFAFSLEDMGYPRDVCGDAIRISWRHNLRQILYYKAAADRYRFAEILHIVKEMRDHFGNRLAFWTIHVPLLLLPNFVVAKSFFGARPLYKTIKRCLQWNTRAIHSDLNNGA